MKKVVNSKKNYIVFFSVIFLFAVMFSFLLNSNFVFAGHVVNTSDGGTSFSINDNTNTQFNITVNNTDAGQVANITQVNITIPSGANCSFVDGSNNSDSVVESFVNTSNVLSWTNSTFYLINGSEWKSFWFNLTCQNSGNYNIIITTTNETGNYNSTLSLEINDTANFNGNLTSPADGTLLKTNTTTLNYTLDSGTFNCSTYVWYNNGTLKGSSTTPAQVTSNDGYYDLSGIDDNIYDWNVYCYNVSDANDEMWLNTTANWTFTIATHEFYGYVMNASNKSQGINNTNITFTIYTNIMRDTIFQQYTGNANSEGWFNITNISFPSGHMFAVSLVKYNETNIQIADYVGPSIPEFQREQLTGGGPMGESIQNTTFYLKKGATINISAHNGTGIIGSTNFSFYQVKDKSLGFPITQGFGSGYTNFTANLPSNRNYTVMIYPANSLPVSLEITETNLSSGYFNYSFNCSETTNRLTGYVNTSSGTNFTSLYVLTYLLEPGRMIYLGEYASGLLNISGDDVYNTSSGFYNISVLGSAEETNAIIMPVAFNNSGDEYYYGGFKSATLNWTGPEQTNFTLKKFKSDNENPDNLSVDTWSYEPTSGAIDVPKVGFNVLNSNNVSVSNPHVEIQLDYSDFNMTNFTFMIDGSVSVPLLDGIGIKKMNVFSQSGGAPLKKKFSNSSLPGVGNGTSVNLTLRQAMEMRDPDGDALGNVFIDMIENSDACNVPNYDSSCSYFGSTQNKSSSDFNPFGVVMSGAEMSFVMKNANNITVIYKNVDMLASGPPDIAFDSDSSDTSTSSSFEQAWKFGSSGPEIYDEVIIGIPYTAGSSSQTGFNESAQMNLTIPYLYDENYNVIWNSSVNGTSNITNADVENELHDFSDYVGTDYENYLNGTYPECNSSDVNLSSGLCYKDISNNMLWFKIPHFSGVGPNPTGSVITATTTEDDDDDSSGSSGSSSSGFWRLTHAINKEQFQNGYTKQLGKTERIRVSVKNEYHHIGIVDLTETKATINVSSTPMQVILEVGQDASFDIDSDDIYDIYVMLISIADNKADITIKEISEAKTEEDEGNVKTEGEITDDGSDGFVINSGEDEDVNYNWIYWLVGLIVVGIVVWFVIQKKK